MTSASPAKLAREISGHQVTTVTRQRWAGLRNGELLRRAESEFDVFVTMDQRLLSQSRRPTRLAIVTLRARSNRLEDLQPLVSRLLIALEKLLPGDEEVIGLD